MILKANVKPLPEFISRMDNPELANGQQEGNYRFWPAAHPRFQVEVGETLDFSLRAKLQNPFVVVGQQAAGTGAGGSAQTLPPESVRVKARPAGRDDGYWLDVKIGPINKAGVFKSPLTIPAEATDLARDVAGQLDVTLTVVESSVVVTPKSVDLGDLSMSGLDPRGGQVGAVNVRKLFGSFRVLEVSSCASFLRFEVQPLIKEKNYLVRIRTGSAQGANQGRIDCPITIKTDDPRNPTIQAALKVNVVP